MSQCSWTLLRTRGRADLHRCLVFEVMGPNSSAMFPNIPPQYYSLGKFAESNEDDRGRLPLWMAKSIIKQTLLGIDFLHKNGIAHGDLQPGNILYSVKDLSSFRESDLAQADTLGNLIQKEINKDGKVDFHYLETGNSDTEAGYFAQRYFDGKPDPTSPRHILQKEPVFRYVDLDPPFLVKLSDLGGAFFLSETPTKPVTPLSLRSPELILGEPIGEAQDIWSLGCLMFELITGTALFSVMPPMPSDWGNESSSGQLDTVSSAVEGEKEHVEPADEDYRYEHGTAKDAVHRVQGTEEGGNDKSDEDTDMVAGTNESTDDDHFLHMAHILGPVPLTFRAKFARSNVYFDDNGIVTRHYVEEPPEGYDASQLPSTSSIEARFDKKKGSDIASKDAATAKELLRRILQCDPTERPTTETLLAHPLFVESCVDV